MAFWTSREQHKTANTDIGPWYDLHGHFLPGIDDGCQSVDEAMTLLSFSFQQGVRGMIATPHYYPEETIEAFLNRRQAAAEELETAIKSDSRQNSFPAWCLGAEAAYYEGIVRAEHLDSLCFGKSRYLLLELPFERWNNSVIRDIHSLINIYNITPIIAHLERYLDIQSKEMLEDLYSSGVLIQMNGGYIIRKTRNAKKRIRSGLVQILGSDTHNMDFRKPNIPEAVRILYQEGMSGEAEQIRRHNEQIFREAAGASH